MSVSDNERGNDRRHPPVGPRRPPIPAHQGTLVTGASRVRCADRDASAPCRARWRPPATTSCQPDRRARVAIALDPPPTLVAGTNALGSPALPENERCPRSSPVLRCLQHHVRTGIRAQCEVGLFRLTFSLENAARAFVQRKVSLNVTCRAPHLDVKVGTGPSDPSSPRRLAGRARLRDRRRSPLRAGCSQVLPLPPPA